MKLPEFLARFGGAFRRKNINSPIDTVWAKTRHNKRTYVLPGKCEIPLEFIRLDPWEGEYLFIVAARATQGIVEIGRFNGGSTLLLACANDAVPIWSIDIEPQNDDLLREIFQRTELGSKVDLVIGDSQTERHHRVGAYDVLFIDGDHGYQGCTRDLEVWFEGLSRGGSVLLHDCYEGSEVMDAIIDFIRNRNITMLSSPYRLANHWSHPLGSMMHFIKN